MQWEMFTRRTDDPKLSWIEKELTRQGIAHRRNGASWHAPILEVDKSKIDEAWEILDPIDDIPDDHHSFVDGFELGESAPTNTDGSYSHFNRFIADDK